MLADRRSAGRTVAEVAARCGFTSATYFSHAFREHFGLRAGDVRAMRRGLSAAPGAGASHFRQFADAAPQTPA